jgi:hypothetical protein
MDEDEPKPRDDEDMPARHQLAMKVLALVAGFAVSTLVKKVYLRAYFGDDEDDPTEDE